MSVQATARIVATRDGLPVLTGEGPLAVRRTRARGPGSRVTVVGAMSAPLGGDRLAIEADVRDGARLTVDAAAATVALPGRAAGERVQGGAVQSGSVHSSAGRPASGAEPARYDVRLTVGEHARLNWLPEQLISAYGSDLRMRTRVEVAATGRLVLREEQILGRHGEEPGTLFSRLTVHRAGRPLFDQELAYGPGAPGGWDGGAVLGGHRAVGQLLVTGPEFEEKPARTRLLGDTAVLTPLAGPGFLVTALAPDALRLRRVLDEVLDEALDEALDDFDDVLDEGAYR
ncbi:urease accessory protein UreD [Streptomyces sp. NPDC088400]|uniref:urease accessory protein UreD n=1 Tax=Streptomyces sp. NPDC088400 TaxID=3365861 RepID=UPI0037F98D91